MQKTFQELLGYIASEIEYAKDDLETNVDKEAEPNTYWYMFGVITIYEHLAKKIEDEYL
jgi:hypothetical protein